MDIVDIGIIAVGCTLLPMLPDLLANLMTAFLPRDSSWARTARKASKEVRRVTNSVVSWVLMFLSVTLPSLALYFEKDMLQFGGVQEWTFLWVADLSILLVLLVVVETFYFLTLFTDPGFAFEKQGPDAGSEGVNICKKCDVIKPARTHHCSICKKCVMRMDHHCPFTNCCIGLYNERFFFSWLLSLWSGNLYACLQSWKPFRICIVQGIMEGVDSVLESDLARCIATGKAIYLFLPAVAIFLFITVMLGWHTLLIATNQTTIEFLRYRLEPFFTGKKKDCPTVESSGVISNFRHVFAPYKQD